MVRPPKLVDLCSEALVHEVNGSLDDYLLYGISQLPKELFDLVIMELNPLALSKMEDNWPDDLTCASEQYINPLIRKRKRYGTLELAWYNIFNARWKAEKLEDDWQQVYWEKHLQECVDAVAESTFLPSGDGLFGEVDIPDNILEHIGCKDRMLASASDYVKLSYHCSQFGTHLRSLNLQNSLLMAKTSDFLKCNKLVSLETKLIKSSDDVGGLCKLLELNKETLKSVSFILCNLALSSIKEICESLQMKDLQQHGVEHFTIKRSRLSLVDETHVPSGFASFITSGKCLLSLTLSDSQIGRASAIETWNYLLEAPSISSLDLSENDISGLFTRLKWRSSSSTHGIGGSKLSLRVLNLRGCNLKKYDICCLKHNMLHMPNLEDLDLSDNWIGNCIRSLILYFNEIANRDTPFSDLKLENCGIRCHKAVDLLDALSNMKKPLNLLSLKRNRLGSEFGPALGKFLCSGIRKVDVESISLGSIGFVLAGNEITKGMELEHINIRNNQGAVEAIEFIDTLFSNARRGVVNFEL